MKKKLALAALLLTMSLGGFAQKKKVTQEALVGMWQMCVVFEKEVRYLPAFKEFTATNQFYTLRAFSKTEPAERNNIGTYEITKDGKLLEHIALSTSNAALSGKDNTLTVELDKSETTMIVSYHDPAKNQTMIEFWKKIK